MTTRAKRWLFLAVMLFLVGSSLVGWTVAKVVAWARDLPDRIVIDGDAIADSFGHAMAESYHQILRDGDPAIQLQVLNEQLTPAVAKDSETLTWVRNEYRDDIVLLVDSSDEQVSAAASDLLTVLDNSDAPPAPSGG